MHLRESGKIFQVILVATVSECLCLKKVSKLPSSMAHMHLMHGVCHVQTLKHCEGFLLNLKVVSFFSLRFI